MKRLSRVLVHIYICMRRSRVKRAEEREREKGIAMSNGKKLIHPTFNCRERTVPVF